MLAKHGSSATRQQTNPQPSLKLEHFTCKQPLLLSPPELHEARCNHHACVCDGRHVTSDDDEDFHEQIWEA